ncbi:DUF192 domain-containing protein [Arsukibacterium sp.]|jgi:uncharacterized membrane protein (UPF0127 family)|uniref:DUF192 domain-containing protein n=1 Tax=Arsukibacterium sp. TaxID=1977258 RepID=UPI002FD91B95
MAYFKYSWLLLLLLVASAQAASDFALVKVQLAEQQFVVQLADTPALRARGLMFQSSAEPGMLLLYSEPTELALWMKNTNLELDVAFINANWQISRIVPLAPLDETAVYSGGPVIAALEMPRGWFAQQQLGVGAKLQLLSGD